MEELKSLIIFSAFCWFALVMFLRGPDGGKIKARHLLGASCLTLWLFGRFWINHIINTALQYGLGGAALDWIEAVYLLYMGVVALLCIAWVWLYSYSTTAPRVSDTPKT